MAFRKHIIEKYIFGQTAPTLEIHNNVRQRGILLSVNFRDVKRSNSDPYAILGTYYGEGWA